MRWPLRSLLVALAVLATLAGCASSDERQWLKLNGKYTQAELDRDWNACQKSGKVDDACMRSRGWVAVSRQGKPETRTPMEVGAPGRPAPR